MSNNSFKENSYNIICQICKKKKKIEQVRKNWQGVWACIDKACWVPFPDLLKPIPTFQDMLPVTPTVPRNVSYLSCALQHGVTGMIGINEPMMSVNDLGLPGMLFIGGKYVLNGVVVG